MGKPEFLASIAQLFHGATNDEKMQELLMRLSVGCRFSQMLLARLLEVFQIPQKNFSYGQNPVFHLSSHFYV